MLSLSDLLALALAGGALTDVWFNGSIFAEPRAYFEARDASPVMDVAEELPEGAEVIDVWWMRWLDRIAPDWLVELFVCILCFSHHAVIWPALLLLLPSFFVGDPWCSVLRLPLFVMAAIRLGNLINAWAPAGARYERGQDE